MPRFGCLFVLTRNVAGFSASFESAGALAFGGGGGFVVVNVRSAPRLVPSAFVATSR